MPCIIIPLVVDRVQIESTYMLLLFKTMLPSILIGFCLFCVSDIISKRLGFIKEPQKTEKPLDDGPADNEI